MSEAALHIEALQVALPTGQVLLQDVDMRLVPGEVAVLLGGSGAGKSTFSRVLFEPDELRSQGFVVSSEIMRFARGNLGLVPQRGALFDHLDVEGNIRLAIRYRIKSGATKSAAQWLESVGLEANLLRARVGKLSGGQAQRVAVARALASERRLLVLDEPSVGLDPHRVRQLARLLREQATKLGVAVIVVTHDPALAAGVADKLYLLDPTQKTLKQLFAEDWPGPVESPEIDEETRGRWILRVESEVSRAIAAAPIASPDPKSKGSRAWAGLLQNKLRDMLAPFAVAGHALVGIPKQATQQTADFLHILGRVLVQSVLRPAAFYAIVSTLIGFTLLFVISKVGGAGVRTDALLRQIGGSYAVALAPPLSAILFVAASGSATNAWLGSMGLTRQTAALEALGISKRNYLWAPAWLGLALAYLLIAAIVTLGMLVGGYLLCRQHDLANAWQLLTADIVDPRPERSMYVGRALFLLWFYAWGMASNIIAKGGSPKHSADDVTRAMTGSVVSCTLWVVMLELGSVLWIFRA